MREHATREWFDAACAPTVLRRREPLGEILLQKGAISRDALDWALYRQRRHWCRLGDVLRSHGLVDEETLAAALAEQFGTSFVPDAAAIGDPILIDTLTAAFCAEHDVLPLRNAGGVTLMATSDPYSFDKVRSPLERVVGPVAMVVMGPTSLRRALRAIRRHALVRSAETRVAARESCRTFGGIGMRTGMVVLAAIVAILIVAAPMTVFIILTIAGCIVCNANTLLLFYASAMSGATRHDTALASGLALARLPPVSILVPLYREREIAAQLIDRLSALKYPRELLDICLVVEDCDRTTRQALAAAELPRWMRVIAVPDGTVRTKPRAMNFALDFCRGDIIGIYDAEDAPASDQILRVVHRFAAAPAKVGCLQGRLNFYNPRASWLTRCFTVDYAAWFELVLPALHRLGWPIPLGGTTVFFRRAALCAVGAWDAHNVTEDADLGMRLARHGYRTDLLHSVTLEEATSGTRAWINQRSRWQKGYAITWLVQMRTPLRLLRDLGAWRFLGVQVLFLGSLGGALFAPILWSFWLLAFDMPHPLQGRLGDTAAILLVGTLVASLVVNTAMQIVALRRIGRLSQIWVLPLMHLYHSLSSVALVKALYELLTRPFFWHKTSHGVTAPDIALIAEDRAPHRA